MASRPAGRFFAAFAVVTMLGVCGVADAQAPAPPTPSAPLQPAQQAPPRDARPQGAPAGTAIVRGRVVAADGNRPLRRVQIRFSAPGAGPQQGLTTSTDENGRYEMTALPAARYTVTATRGGFLQLRYGQRRPREQGKVLEVADAQTIENIDFALPKMSMISGRVLDEEGEPIAGVTVMALRTMYLNGSRQLVPTSPASLRTDDLGEYRIGALMPGTYAVVARSDDKWMVESGDREVSLGYLPTYFPGAARQADAALVTVGVGQEIAATNVSLIAGRTATVSGTALDSRGRPFRSVALAIETRSENGGMFSSGGSTPVTSDGTFRFSDVAPGDYVLEARTDDNSTPEVAMLPVTVDGNDLTNLNLTGSSGGTVSGHVVLDAAVTAPMPRVQIAMAERVLGQPSPMMLGAFRGRYTPVSPTATDGSFTIQNVFGPAPIDVTLPEGWTVKSITQDRRDLTDARIELRNGEQLTGLQVVLTNLVSRVTGTLTDANGSVADGTVVMFSADSGKWFEGSRFVRAVRPNQQGRYQINGLPAGDYFAVALDYVEDGSWNDPEFIGTLRDKAQAITVDSDTPRTLPLTVINP